MKEFRVKSEEHCHSMHRMEWGWGVGGGGHIMVLWYNGDLFKVLFMYIIGKKKMFQVVILELFYFLYRSIYGLIVMN